MDEARNFMTMFQKRLSDQIGVWKSFENLGAVSRRAGKFHLAPVLFQGDKGNVYRLVVWEGNNIYEFRQLPQGNTKEFEHKSGNTFYSTSNDRTITFGVEKDKPYIDIGTLRSRRLDG